MVAQKKKQKIFRDSIHGYITIPVEYCDYLIDTPHFQRLRNIEQTSMRVLYPSAHHDRFIHSLGVYHLGKIAFDNLERNIKDDKELGPFDDDQWYVWRHSFLIACLMHDCAHSPFSHTFESYYDRNKNKPIKEELAKLAKLKSEISELPSGAPHEKVSAIIILKVYKKAIRRIIGPKKYDPNLIVRMITGWNYQIKDSEEQEVEDCLIHLLNGTAIDVDKLDYIIRDTWASGFNNTTIDINRLLSALTITTFNDQLKLTFKKSALSVIQNVIIARNYLYRWIYPHHKVIYDTYILEKAVQAIPTGIGIKRPSECVESLEKIFSVDALLNCITIRKKKFYMPNDGDLIYYIKNMSSENKQSFAYEWISRKHKCKALWKSYAEFCLFFPDKVDDLKTFKKLPVILKSFESKHKIDLGFIIINAKAKLIKLSPSDLYIYINNTTVQYKDIQSHTSINIEPPLEFPYVYIDKKYESRKSKIISHIKKNL